MPMMRPAVASSASARSATLPLPDLQHLHDADGISGSDYARKSRRLIELTVHLKALGANHFLDIPRIVFTGNQSAGKSSVVEAITGISVPRESGTCTRCAMECTMSKASGPWLCSINLRLEFSKDEKELSQVETVPFADVHNASEVELWLKRAQAAILCPDIDPTDFHDKTGAQLRAMQESMLPFSLNTIELHVRDPRGADLSFVDLPGIIQHHREDPDMVRFVRKLVERAIKGKNTLIVVTVPMTDDIENQQAFVLASAADKDGLRTIGVGTKPDMLPPGNVSSLQKWKDIFQGNEHTLRHGYYCVKLPNDAARAANVTRADSQRDELEFFDSTEPWMSLPDRNRFGICNFVKNTSRLLISLIESNLPELKNEVDKLLIASRNELTSLPTPVPTGTPLAVVMTRISTFCKAFQETILGVINKDFVHRNRSRYLRLKSEIMRTAPNFEMRDQYGRWTKSSSEFGDLITRQDVRTVIEANLTWELPGYVPFEATKHFVLKHVHLWENPMISCFEDVCKNTTQIIDRLLDEPESFGRFAELKLFVKSVIRQEQNARHSEASTMLQKMFNLERNVPLYTENRDVYAAERGKWFGNLEYVGHDEFEDECKVMADAHAYFQVASKRFIDQVPLAIEGELHRALAFQLEGRLFEKIEEAQTENLAAMLREDPEIVERREYLSQRIQRLVAIKEKLQEYEYEQYLSMPHSDPERRLM